MSFNYSEQMFEAIDTIVAQRLNQIGFDKTSVYTIVSQDSKDKHKYWVTDGTVRFIALSSSEVNYKPNQKVYVTIPGNDYANDKIISGIYTQDMAEEKITYTAPFKKMAISRQQAFSGNMSLKANITQSVYKTTNINFSYKPLQTYDYIGIKFACDTSLVGTNGSYALIIQLLDSNNKVLNEITTANPNDLDGNTLVISSKQIYGNPNQMSLDIEHEFLLPYPKNVNPVHIKKIKAIFTQDNLFEEQDTNKTIKLSNLSIAFGYDTVALTNGAVYVGLDNSNSLTYSPNSNVKCTLYLDWIYNNNTIYNLYNKTPSTVKYSIYWLKYVDGIGENKDKLPDCFNWQTEEKSTNFKYIASLDTSLSRNQYKIVIKYDTGEKDKDKKYKYFTSQPIIFETNQVVTLPGATNASGDSIQFYFSEGCNGIFNHYGLDGKILETKNRGPYKLYAKFLDGVEWDLKNNSRIKSVKWDLPTTNTMLNTKEDMLTLNENQNELTFYIRTQYLYNATNNRINCTVKFTNGEVRRGSVALQFGEAKTSGSNYSFNIDFMGVDNCLYLATENVGGFHPSTVDVQASFYKTNGEIIAIPNITWSWCNPGDDDNVSSEGIKLIKKTNTVVSLEYASDKFPVQTTSLGGQEEANFAILKATISNFDLDNGVSTDLNAYLPIPLVKKVTDAKAKDYSHISGATRIVYDTLGNRAVYSTNGYALYQDETKITKDIQWFLVAKEGSNNGIPKLRSTANEEVCIAPSAYCPETVPQVCIKAARVTETITPNGSYDKTDAAGTVPTIDASELTYDTIWLQPLLIIKDSWNSDMINEWDGSVSIDGADGSIKAPMFMAGKKEQDNLFTGVLIGDVSLATNVRDVGVYGFQKSSRRFSFTEQGEAFIGNDNGHYLRMDKNGNMEIKMKTFLLSTDGMAIDSANRQITITSKEKDNSRRVALGWLNEKSVYGLDIYEGCIRVYGCPWREDLTTDDAALYFDGDTLHLNGFISRTSTKIETDFQYGEYKSSLENRTTTTLGEQSISLDIDSSGYIKENWLSGITFNTHFYNTDHAALDQLTCIGVPSGRTIAHLTDATLQQAPPFLMFNQSTQNTKTFIITASQSSNPKRDTINCTTIASALDGATHFDNVWGEPKNSKKAASLCVWSHRQQAQKPDSSETYWLEMSGISLYGTYYSDGGISDARMKHDIELLADKYEVFFDNLVPKRYKYNNGTSGRYHTGFIAQEIVTALETAAIPTQEFAGVMLRPKIESEPECYYLRRDEFVAINTWQIQKLKARVTELEKEIKEIKNNEI